MKCFQKTDHSHWAQSMTMSHNRTKGRKLNKPSFNVRKNLVNSKIQSTFTLPTRKKSEKHTESLLESGHYDGITSFNPYGQRITLEDAVVSFSPIRFCNLIPLTIRNWKPFVGDQKRSAFIMVGYMESNSMMLKSQQPMASNWRRRILNPSWCVSKLCSSETFSSQT